MPRSTTRSLAALAPISLVFLAIAAVPESAGAQAPAPAAVLQAQGVLGTWAVNCNAGASPSNLFITFYTTKAGQTRRRTDRGTDGALDGAVDAARPLTNNRVRMRLRNDDQNWGKQNGITAEIVVAVTRRNMQTLDAFANDGAEVIREGRFVTGGAPAPMLERCSK